MEMEGDHRKDRLTVKNVSYLRARDPSILAFNRPDLAQVRTNLIADLESETILSEPKNNDNIRVYLRIKNANDTDNLYKIEDNTLVCNVPPNSTCMRNMREGDSLKKMFTFTKIFHPETTQTEIFNSVVKPKILDFINGQNSTLLTYGASGSGKTFTVIGTDEEPGVLPRSLEYLFRTLPQLSKSPLAKPQPAGSVIMLDENDYKKEKMMRKNLLNSSSSIDRNQHTNTYRAMQQRLSSEPAAQLDELSDVSLAVWVSFAEIYNEQIYDLLQPNPLRGKQRERLRLGCSNGYHYIKNLTNISVTSGLEAYQILQHGIHNLNYASTNLNSHSSRSHSIFTIKLVQVSESDGGTYVSCFNFCDLAGCERTKKTMNVGERLKESNNINSSLLVLGRCISAIREAQRLNDNKLVPFRESKLTQLFQKALAGHEDIAMIVTISPKPEMFDETQHVLNFSAVAKDIAIDSKEAEKIPRKKGRFSLMAQEKKRKLEERNSSLLEEDCENDVAYWQNVALLLQSELSEQEGNAKMNLDFVKSEYEKILKDVQDSAEERVKRATEFMKMDYEWKISNLKAKYAEMLKEKEQVICLESSDDEEEERLRAEIEELRRENASLQKTLMKLRIEVDMKDEQIKKLSDDNEKQRQLIDEGVAEVGELLNENGLLKLEYEKLKKKCVTYDLELMDLKEQRVTFIKNESDSDQDDDQNDQKDDGEDLCKEITERSTFLLTDDFNV